MRYTDWLDPTGAVLTAAAPLPLDTAFTPRQAESWGVSRRQLARLLDLGLVRPVIHGVYAAAQAPDNIKFRCAALALVVSDDAIVTDRAAGWLHGMPLLRRGAHVAPPAIEVSHRIETRVRRDGFEGHRRYLLDHDVMVIDGVRVTTPLRTVLDLGRQLWRGDALTALDAGLAMGIDHESMLREIERFRGFRGVRQLRMLAPLADPRAESPGESALRMHWYDALLPTPELQVWVHDGDLPVYRLDLANVLRMLAAEYDGVDFHTSDEQVRHDRERREWLTSEGWTIGVFTRHDVYSPHTRIHDTLRQLTAQAKPSGPWRP